MKPSASTVQPQPRDSGKAAVVLITDKNYFLPTFAAALSADAHTGEGIAVCLFVVDADEIWIRQFDEVVSDTKISIRAAGLPELKKLSRFHRDVVPPIALARLWLGYLLDDDIDRFLYVDGDVMVDGELDSLLATAPPEEGLRATPDFMKIYIDEFRIARNNIRKDLTHLQNLGCIPQYYFNSGVIYTSRHSWNHITRTAIKFLLEHPEHCLASDQSALNHAARGRVDLLPLRYNYQSDHMMALDPREQGIKPTIWHFVGAPKPWDGAGGWPWNDEYFNKFHRQAETRLDGFSVSSPVPPQAQLQAGLAHRERARFRLKWVYPWRKYSRRRKIASMLVQ